MARLGIWVIHGQTLIQALHRAHEGEDPEIIYAELYANSDITETDNFNENR